MRLLVVDDSHSDVAMLNCALQSLGQVDITSIENGRKALQFLRDCKEERTFDLVVMDWRMPGVAGEELAGAFFKNPAIHPHIPIVILSCAIPPAVSQMLHGQGALVLEKPADLEGYEVLASNLRDLAKRSTAALV